MIDVMKKLQEIAEAGYDNEDIQRGIDAAGKHTVAEAQSPAQKAAFQKMLDAKKGDNPEAEDDEEKAVEEGAVSEKVSNLYPSDPGQDDEGDDEGSDPRLYPDYPEDPGQDDEGDDEGSDPRLYPDYPEDPQIDADIERLRTVADIASPIGDVEDTGGWENIYNADGSLADIAKDSGWTSIGGAKPAPAPNDDVNPGLYPDAPAPNDDVNPGLYPDAPGPYTKPNPGLYPDAPGPYTKPNPGLYPDNVKQDKIRKALKPNEFGVIENEEAIVDETVEVNVNELAELMQLAGYTNYAEKVEEYANEPEAEYMSAEEQLIGLSGGLNGPKKMYPAAAGGDNPMDQEPREVTESTFDTFYAKYDKFISELKDSE
jgi:hypothetical protein